MQPAAVKEQKEPAQTAASGQQQPPPPSSKQEKKSKTPATTKKPGLKSSAGFTDDRSTLGGGGLAGFGGVFVSLENIHVASYVCDFGNVVAGATKRKTFRLTNVGKLPVTFNFDTKVLQAAGISIDPNKAQKVPPNSSVPYAVVYATRKNARHGRVRHIVPIDVKYGPSYVIEFVANLTIPELSMPQEPIDFGKVCVGTRRTIKIRFEN